MDEITSFDLDSLFGMDDGTASDKGDTFDMDPWDLADFDSIL